MYLTSDNYSALYQHLLHPYDSSHPKIDHVDIMLINVANTYLRVYQFLNYLNYLVRWLSRRTIHHLI